MERIRNHITALLTMTNGKVGYDLIESAVSYWHKELNEPTGPDMDIINTIVNEEVTRYYGGVIGEPVELPVLLSKEEAVSVAKALGGDDKAADLKAEICAKAAADEKVIEDIKG